jgi:hypothetical protein
MRKLEGEGENVAVTYAALKLQQGRRFLAHLIYASWLNGCILQGLPALKLLVTNYVLKHFDSGVGEV